MKIDARSADADKARVEEILRGASRGPLDPDLELTAMLSELRGHENDLALERALERLAKDAHQD